MRAVVNHLPLQKTSDWAVLARLFEAFEARLRAQYPTFRGGTLIRAGDEAGILVVSFYNRETLDTISKNVAAPWFAEQVRLLLAGAVSRSVGEVVAGSALR
jgi:hypothetical protein